MVEKYIVSDASGLLSPSYESSSVLYITPMYTSSRQEWIVQGMQQNMSWLRCEKNPGISNLAIFYSLQSIWLLLLIGLDI